MTQSSANKTQATAGNAAAYLATLPAGRRRDDAFVLLDLFAETTGFIPTLWGDSIIGFGQYHYRYASGREGDFLATGFSPRKAAQSIYIMPGYQDYADLLAELGPHKSGKSCLYVTRLDRIDLDVLRALITRGLGDLDKIWSVGPSPVTPR